MLGGMQRTTRVEGHMAMRVVTSFILPVTPPVGTALTLWATFQWDLPVPLALIFVSLAWAYSLGLVVAALVASREDESAEDVLLDHGIVESIDRDSQDSSQIELLVGTDRQRFTAPDAMVRQLDSTENISTTRPRSPFSGQSVVR